MTEYAALLDKTFADFVPEPDPKLFRKWHVEALINQIADLADRALKDRSEYFDLKAKHDLFVIERDEAERRIRLLEKQVSDGMFAIEGIRLDREIQEREALHGRQHERTQTHTLEATAGTSGKEWSSAFARHYEAVIAARLNELEIFSKRQQRVWETKNNAIRTIGLKDMRDVEAGRKLVIMGPEFVSTAALHRYQGNISHISARLTAAQDGLDQIYNYFAATGTKPLKPGFPGFKIVDEVIAWVRPVIRWLAAFGQLDQAWTAVFSVRELVGEATFQAAISGAVPATFQFVLPRARLESHAFTRVRGLALFAECGTLTGPMRARVTLPKRATVRRPKVAAEVRPRAIDLEDYALNQDDLPSCYFGRVQAQNSPRAPEIVGLISLANASPISDATAAPENQKWTLELAPFAGTDLKTCRDLHLELNLLGRTIQS